MLNLIALFGLAVIVGVAYALSEDRARVSWRTPLVALGVLLLTGAFFFLTPGKRLLVDGLNATILAVLDRADDGIAFLFGDLASAEGGTFILAIQALPLLVFFGAAISLLYHIGVMQWLIKILARVFTRLFRFSGAEALAAASNIFVGVESAMTVRPYLAQMTRSELFMVLTVGMSTIASTVLAAYVRFLQNEFPTIAVHLISASFLSVPAAVCVAKIMCPEREQPLTLGRVVEPEYERCNNWVESILRGANEGMKVLLGVCAALIAFIGLVSVLNLLLSTVGGWPNRWLGVDINWTVQGLFGYVYYPFICAIGVPHADALTVAQLVGDRLVLTEFSSYLGLAELIRNGALQPRSVLVVSYVLCGFAHIASLAIFVGGTAALAPSRMDVLGKIGLRALVAANLACLLTGATASLFYHAGLQVLATTN
ncbi:MAG: nucleoside transporter [Lentisphaerae bacterium]|jgi:concentrative nucleoside transporter, CNT family|nr:nucleoside transporter [Lentisphaerota bacterium]MBT4822737.1 nucleoside transporter [Lentisphaerota bacterium]MBT5607996.1 nucleoside transporter [Lentisphaerota bacterium]MBT7057523.1 nucleoside transporter [Lentisphaerota bacterium]MBT7845669.1 nucleoside transporter [Lentisphaerota bacterium]